MDGRILIIDDVATNRIVLKVKLGAASYHPIIATNGVEGLMLARKCVPDLILLDLMLPDLPGLDVLRALRNDPVTRDVPVIVVSCSTTLGDRLAALEAGADDIFLKPYDDDLMMARLRNLLRSRQEWAGLTEGSGNGLFIMAEPEAEFRHPGHLTLVTDQTHRALKLRQDLTPLLRDTISVMTYDKVLSDAQPASRGPDIYLIDVNCLQSERGLRLLSDLRSRPATRHAGICLIDGAAMQNHMIMALDLGANDVLNTDMTLPEIALRLRAVLRSKRRSDLRREQVQDGLRLAMIDPLTGLFNRRYASARMLVMATRSVRDGRPLAVMVVDIDRFKTVNDQYGHAIGDDVLIEVGHRLGCHLRAEDLLARIGGEEFLIALSVATIDEAQSVARRLCHEVEQRPVLVGGGTALTVTVSIGLAMSQCEGDGHRGAKADTVDALIARADQALLSSKRAGRNQVTLARTAA